MLAELASDLGPWQCIGAQAASAHGRPGNSMRVRFVPQDASDLSAGAGGAATFRVEPRMTDTENMRNNTWGEYAEQVHSIHRAIAVVAELGAASSVRLRPLDTHISHNLWEDTGYPSRPVLVPAAPFFASGLIRVPAFDLLNRATLNQYVRNALWPMYTDSPWSFCDWDSKLDRVVWRGALSSISYTTCTCATVGACACDQVLLRAQTWCDHPRCQAVRMSLASPTDFDFRFSMLGIAPDEPGFDTAVNEGVNASRMLAKRRLPLERLARYKYVLILEGDTPHSTSLRSLWFLFMRSVTFVQTPGTRPAWFGSGLRAFEHYVPVRADLADLHEKLAWARANPEECKRIVDAAWSFAAKYVDADVATFYVYLAATGLTAARAEGSGVGGGVSSGQRAPSV